MEFTTEADCHWRRWTNVIFILPAWLTINRPIRAGWPLGGGSTKSSDWLSIASTIASPPIALSISRESSSLDELSPVLMTSPPCLSNSFLDLCHSRNCWNSFHASSSSSGVRLDACPNNVAMRTTNTSEHVVHDPRRIIVEAWLILSAT